jgi:predicted small metal-binding protein
LPMTITCAAMGYTCGYEITGDSMDQLISGVKHHALDFHGWTKEELENPEKLEAWKGSIRQTSRPDAIRTPRDESDRVITPH